MSKPSALMTCDAQGTIRLMGLRLLAAPTARYAAAC